MNVHPSAMNSPIVTQQPTSFYESSNTFPSQVQWMNGNAYGTCQLPLQLSQYYNVFPDGPSTKTSWTFPNGCVTSNIVRFTGLPTPTYPNGSSQQLDQYRASGMPPIKRKSLLPDDETLGTKVFITEEKMAARMSGMHISNEFVSHDNNNAIAALNEDEMRDDMSECTIDKSNPQLVICDELKDLHTKMNSIIPESLIPLERPSTALVLWRPPMRIAKLPKENDDEHPTRSSVVITDITDRPDLDNNNISTLNLNSVVQPSVEYPPETDGDSMEM